MLEARSMFCLIHPDIEGGVVDVGGPSVGLCSENGIKVIGYAITYHDIGAMLERVSGHRHQLPPMTLCAFRPDNRLTRVGVDVA